MAAPVFATNDVPTAAQVNSWFTNVNYAEKTSDTSRNTTIVLADDPELSVAVEANAKYMMTSMILYSATSQAAGDLNLGFAVPAGAAMMGHASGSPVAGTTAADDLVTAFSEATTLSFGVIGIAAPWTALLLTARVSIGGTAGTVKIRWCQASSNATNTTLRIGSFLNLDRKS
jgi:hypothetical protein